MPARREKLDVSLFPFLSVLCTVIAVMVVLGIMILNTRVVARAEQGYKKLSAGAASRQPGSQDAPSDGIDNERYRQLEEEVTQLSQSFDERKSRMASLRLKFKELQALLESLKDSEGERIGGAGREAGAPDPITMVPLDGQEIRLKPIFVEVRADGYTVHPSKQHFPAIQVQQEVGTRLRVDLSSDLREFLTNVDTRRQQEYLVFLIHPNGATAFSTMRSYLLFNYSKLRMGWEPFARTWIMTESEAE